MNTLFADKPKLTMFVKVAFVAFIALSIVNLYYSIKVNRELLKKTST